MGTSVALTEIKGSPGSPGLQRTDYGMLLVLGAIWGSAFPVIRLGLLAGVPPLLFAGTRCALGAVGVAGIALFAQEPLPSRRSFVVSSLLGGILLIGGYFAFLYVGEEAVPGGLASILVATSPLWSAGFAILLLPKEKLGRHGVVGLGLGFVGIIVIFLPGALGHSGISPTALLEVLMAPLLFALGAVLLRRLATGPQGYWGISTQLGAGSGVLLAGALVLEPGVSFPWAAPAWISLLYLVMVPTCIGYAVYFLLHHRVGPTQANLVSYVSPVSGLLVGGAVLAEVPSIASLSGLAVVALGLFLVGRDRPSSPGERAVANAKTGEGLKE